MQGHSDTPFSSWKQKVKSYVKGTIPVPGRRKRFLSPEMEICIQEICAKNLVKITLILLSYFFTIYYPSPNSCVLSILQKFVVLCQMCNSFLLWTFLQIFIVLWRNPCTWKNWVKCVRSSPINLCSVSFILGSSWRS